MLKQGRIIGNTLTISLYSLIAGFPFPIILAIILNYVKNIHFKKFAQTVTYMPYFISTVVLVGMMSLMVKSFCIRYTFSYPMFMMLPQLIISRMTMVGIMVGMFYTVTFILLLLLLVVILYPLWFVLMASFSDAQYVNNGTMYTEIQLMIIIKKRVFCRCRLVMTM